MRHLDRREVGKVIFHRGNSFDFCTAENALHRNGADQGGTRN